MKNNFGIKNAFDVTENVSLINEDFEINENTLTPNKIKTEIYLNSLESNDLIINVLKNQELTLVETINSKIDITKKLQINIAENAHVKHFILSENEKNLNQEVVVNVLRNAVYTQDVCELGLGDTTAVFDINLQEENAHSSQLLIALGRNSKQGEYKVTTNHNAPNTAGNMKNHGVCLEESRIHIDGIGYIGKGNYKAASHQENKVMILGAKATAQTNPFLLIEEYDVDASHAASVGQISEDELYYLQSRGLPLESAKKLVVKGFILPVADKIKNELMREMLIEKIDALLK